MIVNKTKLEYKRAIDIVVKKLNKELGCKYKVKFDYIYRNADKWYDIIYSENELKFNDKDYIYIKRLLETDLINKGYGKVSFHEDKLIF